MSFLGVGSMIKNPVIFDLDIYSIDAIQQAVSDYKEYAEISISVKKDNCICYFRKCNYDIMTTIQEFANYALMLSIQKRNHL